jgi:hypothetical protein
MILQKKVVTKELSNGLTRALAQLATVLIWVKHEAGQGRLA